MKSAKKRFNKFKEGRWILALIFGLLLILRNYVWVNYRGYKVGVYYYAMNFVGIIAIVYGLYFILNKI